MACALVSDDGGVIRMGRRPFVGGNWKMHTDRASAAALAQEVALGIAPGVDVAVFPPFPYLLTVAEALSAAEAAAAVQREGARPPVALGAQDCYFEPSGAFTGEVSVGMLRDCGVGVVLTGHSERRHVIGESDELVNRKTRAVLGAGLECVLCIGETLAQREAGETDAVNERQLRAGLAGVGGELVPRLTIAYEPVWAIGTGRNATPADAQDAQAKVRAVLERLGYAVSYNGEQTCCGQPAFNAGHRVEAAQVASRCLDAFREAGTVVCPSGSCTAMVRNYFPLLFRGGTRQAEAAALGKRVFEFSEFLTREDALAPISGTFPGRVGFHNSCHSFRELRLHLHRQPPRIIRQPERQVARTLALLADVTKPDEVNTAVRRGLEQFGKIDVLVNVLGIRPHKAFLDIDFEEWQLAFNVNCHSLYHLAKAVIPGMIERKGGSIVALVGPTGAGKSTIVQLLARFYDPQAGRIFIDGVDIRNVRLDSLRSEIGFVFQGFNLLSRTSALENVELPMLYLGVDAATRHQRAMEALAAVGLAGREQNHPNQLSGGQQQRVAVARSLVNNPALILADEPTGNLDSRTSVEVMEIFQRLNRERGITLVLVTHETDIAQYAQRVVVFKDGKIKSDQPVIDQRDAAEELKNLPLIDDDEDEDDENTSGMLPPLQKGMPLEVSEIQATERFTKAPARYTEASLVKKLEELGIGRQPPKRASCPHENN